MIKLPSLHAILVKAKNAFARFPLTILSSMAAAIVAMYLFEQSSQEPDYVLINLMLTLALGIPVFFSAGVLIEQKKFKTSHRVITYAVSAILLFLVYLSFPVDQSEAGKAIPYIRYIIFNVAAHLLVSFIPYYRSGDYHGFWQYNKSLFLRILEAVLYSGFLYTGLALAMGALELLFDLDIPEKLYFHLFIFIAGFFNTWFFVAGVPHDLDTLEQEKEYPSGLKIFTQYILLPLLSIYFVILYSYGMKILASWNWPEGIVAYLIICVAVVGIFLVLLLYPYQQSADNQWIKRFSRLYYAALAPLVVILFIAIGIRIGDYGITVNRYIILLLGVWLTITCIYYLVGKKNIKFIPISLSVMLLLASFGPWGIFAVSERSQMNRLRSIFENNQLLENGKIQNQATWQLDEDNDLILEKTNTTNTLLLSDSLQSEVKSILDYLDDFHDLHEVNAYLDQNIEALITQARENKEQYINRTKIYMEAMGLDYFAYFDKGTNFYGYTSTFDNVTVVKGYDYLINFSANRRSGYDNAIFLLDERQIKIELDDNAMYFLGEKMEIIMKLDALITKLEKKHGKQHAGAIDQDIMSLAEESDRYRITVLIDNINLENTGSVVNINAINGKLLVKVKE